MPTQLDIIKPFERFPIVECPGCKVAMALREMQPVLLTQDLYTATYCCLQCGTETRREFKREYD